MWQHASRSRLDRQWLNRHSLPPSSSTSMKSNVCANAAQTRVSRPIPLVLKDSAEAPVHMEVRRRH